MRRAASSILSALALAAAVVVASPVQAAPITYNLVGTVANGIYTGLVGTGSFTFDGDLIVGSGAEQVDPVDGLTVEFTLGGQTFTQFDDIDYNAYPVLSFLDGVPISLNYIIEEDSPSNPTAILLSQVLGIYMLDLVPLSAGIFSADVDLRYTAVPLPAALPLLAGGLLVLGAAGWRRRARTTA